MATKLVRPASDDPENSVSLFDRDRQNELGEVYCVAPCILLSEVDEEWERYMSNPIPMPRVVIPKSVSNEFSRGWAGRAERGYWDDEPPF